jgi:BASS family bile acid:Na+ symporter
MGLDATLVLITLVTTTALVPFTAPLIASLFFGGVLSMSPLVLGLKLIGLLAGAIVVATVIRRLAGPAAIVRYGQAIDGFTVIVLLVLVSGLMGSVAMSFWADPVGMLLVSLLAFGTAIPLLGLTVLVFRKAGHERAWALGHGVPAQLGLMLAAANGGRPA